MTPNELTTILAEPAQRQFDEPYKLMLFDRAMVWYSRHVRNTLGKDARRRKEFIRPVIMELSSGDPRETLEEVPAQLYANGISFDYVGGTDGSSPFVYTSSPSNLEFFKHSKYPRPVQYYTYLGGKIQVLENQMIRKVRIDGLFLDPKVTARTSGMDMATFWDTDMRIPGDILQLIIQSMEQNDLRGGPVKNNPDEQEVTNG